MRALPYESLGSPGIGNRAHDLIEVVDRCHQNKGLVGWQIRKPAEVVDAIRGGLEMGLVAIPGDDGQWGRRGGDNERGNELLVQDAPP